MNKRTFIQSVMLIILLALHSCNSEKGNTPLTLKQQLSM